MKENQASSTAFSVLQGILYIAQSTPYAFLVSDEMASIGNKIMSASEEGQKRIQQIQSPWFLVALKIKEYLLLPGITLHYVLRKRYIEDKTRQVIADGVTQVVNLGAGFDTLAWQLHEKNPQVNFIEIDHPDTSLLKTQALVGRSPDLANMHFLSVDFNHQNLEEALNGFSKFEAQRPTLFICEGVMMYLEASEIDLIYESIAKLTGTGTLLLFTGVEPQGSKRSNVPGLLFTYLKLIGEPIKSAIDSEIIPEILSRYTCELQSIAATDDLRKSYIKGESTGRFHYGEYLVLTKFL